VQELVGALRDDLRAESEAWAHSPERLFSITEAAELLAIGRTLTYDLIGQGQLRSIRVGRRRLVPQSAIDELVASPR
jgi:excisionase family DNA binding protein